MALAYTAPTWEDGSGTGISASQLQALCNCVEGLVQGSDKAVHNITFSGSTMTLTFADGSQETAATSVRGVSSITKTGSSLTDPVVDTYTITYSDGTTSTFQITNGAKGDTGATPVITVSATADAIASLNPSVTVTKTGTDEAPHFSMAFSGLKGQTGEQGEPGTDGTDGYSPVVTITNIQGGHRVNITDADHPTGQNFDVMNGDGAGDMLAQDYDSTSAVANAGGIPAYVAANAMATNGSNADSMVKFSNAFTVGTRYVGEVTAGTKSFTSGTSNSATGENAVAIGNGNEASADNTLAIGGYSIASAAWAFAGGRNGEANGARSFAFGNHALTSYDEQVAFGEYNKANNSNRIFMVGNGDSNARSNAFEVYKDGSLSEDNGTTKHFCRRLKNTITLSTSTTTDTTFTDATYITADSILNVYTDIFGVNPSAISVDGTNHTCTLTFPKHTSAATLNVILEVCGFMS